MDDVALKITTIAVGVSTGGGLLLWFGKSMATRLIKQYDEKHARHERRLEVLAEKFSEQLTDFKIKLARMEPLLASAISFREDLKSAEGEIAVLEHRVEKVITKDLKETQDQVRVLFKKLDSLKN